MNEDIKQYVEHQLANGASQEEIQAALRDVGWNEADIQAALNSHGSLPTNPGQSGKLPGVGALLKEAWQAYFGRLKTFVGIELFTLLAAIPILVGILLLFIIFSSVYHSVQASILVPVLLASIIIIAIALTVLIASLWSHVALLFAIKDRADRIGVKESYRRARKYIWAYWWLSILMLLVSAAGFGLVIVFAFIFGVWFCLSTMVLVAEEKRGLNAMIQSREYTRGYWWTIFGRMIVLLVVVGGIEILLGLIPNVGKIIEAIFSALSLPFVLTFMFLIYEHLRSMKGEVAPRMKRASLIWLSILGIVVIPIVFFLILWLSWTRLSSSPYQSNLPQNIQYYQQ